MSAKMGLQEQGTLGDIHEDDIHDQNDSDHSSRSSSPHASPRSSLAGVNADGSNKAPVQKRRRVTRACDECRRKKIKCDGKQPCTHCTVYSYECTYDQPSNRRRNATPQYIEALEAQLKRADSILKLVLPAADLSDPNLEAKVQRGVLQGRSQNGPIPTMNDPNELDTHLESMVKSAGQLELDGQGNIEFHGHSSGLSFVRKMRESLGDGFLGDPKTPVFPPRYAPPIVDSPRSSFGSPRESVSPTHDLPSREVALELCDSAINDAGALLRFVHWPSFLKSFNTIYDKPLEQWGNDENTFLPLLYAALALGSLFNKKEHGDLDKKGYESAISEGYKYFKASRGLIDIADCRSLPQIQAVVFMIIFLQSSAKLSTCYAYIGIALRSALRMGLHRSLPEGFNPIIVETRKRVFWIIRKMDLYVSALLGLPHSVNDEDIDQEYPVEVDDEFITEQGIRPQPKGRICIMTAVNAHNELVKIVGRIVKNVYPLKGSSVTVNGTVVKSYSVSYAKIVEIEKELQEWQDKLPMALRPGSEGPVVIQRVQHLLRIAYAHAQMMLYRPFLHYVSQACRTQAIDKRSYACAAACVSVSRNIVHIAIEMQKRKLLIGAYWFTMYTTFFAILSLVFYALENPENNASQDVLRVAKEGQDTLKSLARRSMAADRCSTTLNELFEHLPERFKRSRLNSIASRKRSQENPSASGVRASESPATDGITSNPRRANTYPTPPSSHHQYETIPTRPTDAESYMFNAPSFPNDPSSHLGKHPLSNDFSTSMKDESDAIGNTFSGPNFPLADLTSMMFPSSDPFEYPNQKLPATETFGQLLRENGQGTNSPMSQVDNIQSQGYVGTDSFVPMDPSFMYTNPTGSTDTLSLQDPNIQLLGPMPMYLMQGSTPNVQTPTSGHAAPRSYNGAVQSSASSSSQPHSQMGTPAGYGGAAGGISRVPDVNIGQLLGDSEWVGSIDGSNLNGMGGFFGSPSGMTPQQQQQQGRKGTSQMSNLSYSTSVGEGDGLGFQGFGAQGGQRWNTF